MSKTKYLWWGYVKNCVRTYPRWCEELDGQQAWFQERKSVKAERPQRPTEYKALDHIIYAGFQGQKKVEFDGVRLALEETLKLDDGLERYAVLDLVFWNRNRKTLLGASIHCHVSKRTAERWHNEFLRLVAAHMGLLDEGEIFCRSSQVGVKQP